MTQLSPEKLNGRESNNSVDTSPSRFPQTSSTVNREEFITPIDLTIRDTMGNKTTLPYDLYGHFFLIGPCGSPQSSPVEGGDQVVWVTKDGWTPIYNGDGMVFRFSFDQGKASLKTRFVKTPCFFADRATGDKNNQERYKSLAFHNLGIPRSSINKLGLRNQLNTNFVPFKLPDDESDRLLVTWDTGRPYEIDPETLETLAPVGKNQDWADLLPDQRPQPFKQLMSSAHPVFDSTTGDLFTVNVGKSIWTLMAFSRSLKNRLAETVLLVKSVIANPDLLPSLQRNFIKIYSTFLGIVQLIVGFLGIVEKISSTFSGGYDFVHLLAWDGKQVGIKGKWNIVLPGNRPLRIDQTVHQMGLTQDYIVFAETSFKFSLANMITYQKDLFPTALKIILANFSDYPQYPTTKLYIVKRSDLKQEVSKTNRFAVWFSRSPFKHLPKVVAKEVEIAPEFSHYLVDYDNPNNQITVYVDHLAATDIAEYIRIFDRSAYDDHGLGDKYNDAELSYRMQDLVGNVVSPMDVSRLGRWVIDGETGKVIDKQLVSNPQLTWSTAFYVCLDQRPTKKYTDIFWNSWGCWPDTISKKAVSDYAQYPHRLVPLDEVLDLTYQGVPSSLCHLKIRTDDNHQTKIEIDSENNFQFNKNHLGTSAQFIPRPNAEDQTDGYIACVVLTSDEFLSQSDREDNDPEWSQNTEIWIFDARNLSQGPLYKLSHPKLNIGFTIHTTWIAEAKSPDRLLDYDVREDHEYLVEQLIENEPELGDKIRKLFDDEIYPHF
ncbi:MAG: carotenoid oxygenase family protein [Pleurocapsa sp. MO_192.B19]|nr:carotenoid oxygenase family protein [Pleurocapsa sp. MO_192.B19]